MMKPESSDDRKVFRIDNNEVTELLKLPDNQKYYSFNQLRPQLDEMEKQASRIEPLDASKRTVFESQLMKLYETMNLYQRLEVSLKPPASDDFAAELDAYQKSIAPGIAAVNARDAGQKFDQDAFNNLLGFMGGYNTVASFALPLTIPPVDPSLPRDDWQNIGTNLMQTARTGEFNPATKFYAAMVTAYRSGQPDDFNRMSANTAPGWPTASRRRCARRARNVFSAPSSRSTRRRSSMCSPSCWPCSPGSTCPTGSGVRHFIL